MRKGQHHSYEARVRMSQAKIGNKNALHATRTLETRTKIGIAQVGNKKRETHGMYGTRVYRSWSMMKNRCLNSNYTEWHLYGGRGIIVCDRWLKFENFVILTQKVTTNREIAGGQLPKNRERTRERQSRMTTKVYKPTVPVRRLPVVLEAVQWFPGDAVVGVEEEDIGIGLIRTLEGDHHVAPGYWVMTGLKGEHWGVAPDIFKETYEILRWCPQYAKGCREVAGHLGIGRWHTYQTEEEGRAQLQRGYEARNPKPVVDDYA